LLWAFFVGIGRAMLQLSSFKDAIAAVERGRVIALSAYTLGTPLVRELESRAQSGARVEVTLEADPSGRDSEQLRRHNGRVAAVLRAYGVDARLERNVHTKTLAVDDAVFLDGSNWRDGDVILRDDAAGAKTIACLKSSAIKEESAMLESARFRGETGAIVETETFDRFNVVSKALREMAAQRLSPRLLIDGAALRHNAREAANVAWIAAQGVEVRVCNDTEKFAVAGDRAWLGSANASAAYPGRDMTDWGIVTEDPVIVTAVRERVEERWATAREYRPLSVVRGANRFQRNGDDLAVSATDHQRVAGDKRRSNVESHFGFHGADDFTRARIESP
jgi:hypothetical protein